MRCFLISSVLVLLQYDKNMLRISKLRSKNVDNHDNGKIAMPTMNMLPIIVPEPEIGVIYFVIYTKYAVNIFV